MKFILALLALSIPAFSGVINCSNANTDRVLIQTALSAGGSTTVNGPCKINSGTLSIAVSGTSLIGGTTPVLTQVSNGSQILSVTADNIVINGVDFEQGTVKFTGARTNITFTNNHVSNVTGGTFSSGAGALETNGLHNSVFTDNILDNDFQGGYRNLGPPATNPFDSLQPACWAEFQGWDGVTIQRNSFTKCGNDGLHLNPNGSINYAPNPSNVSYNYCADTHRACYEIQGFLNNFTMKGNVAMRYNGPFFNSFAYSIASGGVNFTFANNLGSMNTGGCSGTQAAYFLELILRPSVLQGNVAQTISQASLGCQTWPFVADNWGDNTTNAGNTVNINNNVMCGSPTITTFTHETPQPPTIPQRWMNYVDNSNYKNTSSCPVGALATSNVSAPVFTAAPTSFPSGGIGSWTTTQISALPVKWVQFFVDSNPTPIATQEIQDYNTNFTSDLKWHYSLSYDTTALSNGSHTITAVATDVLGATNTTTAASFTRGTGTSPGTAFSPTSLSFGTVTVAVASSPQTVVLTNNGNAVLNISGITIAGTNSGDFSRTTTCGATLAIAATCNIVVTFTPVANGHRNATVSVADDAAGSPQVVALDGTGTGGTSGCPASILTNCDFATAMQTPWLSAVSPFATFAVDATGACGIESGHVTATSTVTPGSNIEMYQDGLTFMPNGSTYTLSFKASINRAQQVNILTILSTSPFTDYGLGSWMPTITTGCNTYTFSGGFSTINTPIPGQGRFTIQMDNMQAGDQMFISDVKLTLVTPASTEVNNIIFPFVSHSSLAVAFTSLTSSVRSRVRYIASPGDCRSGTGGNVQGNLSVTIAAAFAQYSLGGMAPGTQYMVCPEVSKDAVNYSTGAGATVITAAIPSVHPAKPIAPMDFNTEMPNTAGYATEHVNAACSNTDFGAAYSNAVGRWATQGTIIAVAAGGTCGAGPYAFSGTPPDVHTWTPSNVSLVDSSIDWGAAHNFSENDLVLFGRTNASLTTYPASTSCDVGAGTIAGGGIESGQRYQVHVVDTTHIQVRCLPATQVDPLIPSPAASLMTFTTTGSSSTGGFYALPFKNTGTASNPIWERRLPGGGLTPWIIVRPDVADSQLPPEHTTISPEWLPNMFSFTDPLSNITNTNVAHPFIIFGDSDPNFELPVGNIRIMGAQITTQDYATSVHSSDPWFWNYVWETYQWDSSVICDRCYWHMLGTPNRESIGMRWDGSNMGWIDSYNDNLVYFHATSSISVTQTDATHFILGAGSAAGGFGTATLASPVTVTISGSGTGRIFAYFNMLSSNALTLGLPAGITATCSGATCVSAVAGTPIPGACVITSDPAARENATDGWPKTANGEVTVLQIGCADVSAGSITVAAIANASISIWNSEGDSHMLGGTGPGPYKFCRNYSSGAGLTWHWDDGGSARYRGNFNICQNYIYSPLKYMFGSPVSDNLIYAVRQPMEHKGGQNILLKGNIFDTTWREGTPDGAFYAATAVSGHAIPAPKITDMKMESNTFIHGPAVTEGIYTTCNSDLMCAIPGVRFQYINNLASDINGYFYTVQSPIGNSGTGQGWAFQLYATEDNIVNHNTSLPNRGSNPWLLSITGPPMEGYEHLFNIDWFTNSASSTVFGDGSGALAPPGCTGFLNVTFANCAFTQGIGITNYNFGQNLMAGGYNDSSVPTGQVSTSTMSTALTGLTNSYLASGTVPATVTAIGFFSSSNYRLKFNSSYVAGSNGFNSNSNLGVNMDKLSQDQGEVTIIGTATSLITTSGFTISYNAPSSSACFVLHSATNDISTTTPVSDGGGSLNRNVAITGIPSQQVRYGWVLCSGVPTLSKKSFMVKTK